MAYKVNHRGPDAPESETGNTASLDTSQPDREQRKLTVRATRTAVIALVVVLIAAASLYVALVTPSSFGDYNDDAIYLTTAKSLASGHGYRIISLPGQPAQTKYPPFYPFLLSLIWRLYPNFPANLTEMMLLSVLAAVASAVLGWVYLSTHGYASRWIALLSVGLAAVNGFTIVFSTGLFSEMPYMALSIAALLLAESRETSRGSWTGTAAGGVLLGTLMGLAFLTRVTGVTLIGAVGLYFIFRKSRRKALLPLVIAAMFMVAWAGWCHYQRTVVSGTNASYFTSYLTYAYELIKEDQARGHHSLPVMFCLIVKNNALGLAKSAPLMALGYCQEGLGFAGAVGRGVLFATACGLIVMIVGARKYVRLRGRLLPIYLALYILLQLLLPYPDSSLERYLVPILPFLILFLLAGIRDLGKAIWPRLKLKSRMVKRVAAAVAALPLIAIAAFGLAAYGLSLRSALTELRPRWAALEAENAPLIGWIKANTLDTDILACVHHGMYYLYTGRRAALSFQAGREHNPAGDSAEAPETNGANSSELGDGSKESRGADNDSKANKLDSSNDSKKSPEADDDNDVDSSDDSEETPVVDEWLRRILAENKVAYLIITAEDITDEPGGVDFGSLPEKLIKQGVLKQVYSSPDGSSAIYKVAI